MKKEIKLTYLKKADKFLKKNLHQQKIIENLIIKFAKKVIFNKNENIDVKELKGKLKGKYRIRKGKIRIIVSIQNNEIVIEIIVENIDFRGDVYK